MPTPSAPGATRSPPRAILFDFDGVIVDSAPLKTAAFATLYADAPAEARAYVERYQVEHAGISRLRKIMHFEQYLFGRASSGAHVEARVARYGALVEDAVVACPEVPGARDFLERHHADVALHLISGTPHEELERILARRGLARYFRSVTGSPTTKPDAFGRILEAGALAPAEAVAVGDSHSEYEAARDLGIPFVAIACSNERRAFPPGVPVLPDLSGLWAAIA